MEVRSIDSLKNWEKNASLRIREDGDYSRLKNNLEFGQHTPLLIRPDGTVLGGNQRLEAMRELGYTEVECTVLDFAQDEQGFYAVINGKTYRNKDGAIARHFKTIEEGEVALAYSHNMRSAHDKEEGVKAVFAEYPEIEWSDYDFSFNSPMDGEEVVQFFANEGEEDKEPEIPERPTSPKLMLKFKTVEDLQNALAEITPILDNYEGSKYTVSK